MSQACPGIGRAYPTDTREHRPLEPRDRRRLRRARRPLRARRGDRAPRAGLPRRGQGGARGDGLGRRADAPGRRSRRCPGSARRSRRSSSRCWTPARSRRPRSCARSTRPGLLEMTRLPGLGPKRARQLFDELGIDSLEMLRAAAEGQRLRDVKGFGPKFEASVLSSIAAGIGERPAQRVLLQPRAEHRRGDRRGAARASGVRTRRARRLRAPPGRLRQGPRHHRHGLGPGRARARARRART